MGTASDDEQLLREQLALKAIKAVGPGGPEPETPEETFWRCCRNFVRGWQQKHKENLRHAEKPVLFIFSGANLPERILPSAKRVTAFRTLFPLKVGGNVYVCNENLREVREEKVSFKDEQDPLTFLREGKLIACTAVVFLPEQEALLLHERNADLEDVVRLELGPVSQPFKFSDLDSHLSNFYKRYVETHNGACDIWAKVKERKLKPHPERQIQRSLKGYFDLTIAGQGAKVDQEIMTTFGRSDVRVLAYKDRVNWEQAIMELKVLEVNPDPKAWALGGIEQLLDYRKGAVKETVALYLCCYDARKTDADIPEVVAAAGQNSIEHRRYFMKTTGIGMRG